MANWLAYYNGSIIVTLAAVTLLLLGLVAWLLLRLRRIEQRYQALTAGTDGGNLANVLEAHVTQVRATSAQVRDLDQAVRALERANYNHLQHIGFVRFNPFRETGGDQSFVLALADGNGNGAVISTLHSRDITRIYAKPLREWQSAYPFTDEEQQALRQAREPKPAAASLPPAELVAGRRVAPNGVEPVDIPA